MPGTFIISLDCEGYWGIADRDHAIASGFITQNALIRAYASLVTALRDELLNESLFLDLDHVRSRIANWIDDYNQRRPHSGLPHAGGLCRQSLRNMRPAAQPRPPPPIARCSTRALRRKIRRGSNRRWVKLQWQVRIVKQL